jgi:hypothetical protein
MVGDGGRRWSQRWRIGREEQVVAWPRIGGAD